jgi:hypothetical protein
MTNSYQPATMMIFRILALFLKINQKFYLKTKELKCFGLMINLRKKVDLLEF